RGARKVLIGAAARGEIDAVAIDIMSQHRGQSKARHTRQIRQVDWRQIGVSSQVLVLIHTGTEWIRSRSRIDSLRSLIGDARHLNVGIVARGYWSRVIGAH